MMLALNTKKLKLWIAAAALGLVAMAFLAPADARGFGGFRGGISGFHGGGTMRGFGHFRNPVVFMHPGPFRSPFLDRRGFVSRQFFFRRRFADDRQFFFRRDRFVGPFAIGFVGAGYPASGYDFAYATSLDDQGMTQTSPSYDFANATSTQTSPSYDDPYNVGGASGRGCSLLIKVEKSGTISSTTVFPFANANERTMNTSPCPAMIVMLSAHIRPGSRSSCLCATSG